MNAFDYFLKTCDLKTLPIGRKTCHTESYIPPQFILHHGCEKEFVTGRNILLLSPNNKFFFTAYLR